MSKTNIAAKRKPGKGTISMVASGDSLISMGMRDYTEPEYTEMINLIRNADVSFTNFEMLLHDYGHNCYPTAEPSGTYMRAEPSILKELIWMGFDIFSTANNHSLDYMYGGLFDTISYFKAAEIPFSGTGRDLHEARQPAYINTLKGRVALISAASSFAKLGSAGITRRDLRGRPGLNPLRYKTWYSIKPKTMEKLKTLAAELKLPKVVQPEDEAEGYYFLSNKFVTGNKSGIHTRCHTDDLEGNLESIRDAARQSDWVLFSLHAHEARGAASEEPAGFIGNLRVQQLLLAPMRLLGTAPIKYAVSRSSGGIRYFIASAISFIKIRPSRNCLPISTNVTK